jgi:hypothetical protein
LTSFNRRKELHRDCNRSRAAARPISDRFLDRTQHERQWRRRSMADIGEEGRLGAVEFGESLGAQFRCLECLRIAERQSDLFHREIKEGRWSSSNWRRGLTAATMSPGQLAVATASSAAEQQLLDPVGPGPALIPTPPRQSRGAAPSRLTACANGSSPRESMRAFAGGGVRQRTCLPASVTSLLLVQQVEREEGQME